MKRTQRYDCRYLMQANIYMGMQRSSTCKDLIADHCILKLVGDITWYSSAKFRTAPYSHTDWPAPPPHT